MMQCADEVNSLSSIKTFIIDFTFLREISYIYFCKTIKPFDRQLITKMRIAGKLVQNLYKNICKKNHFPQFIKISELSLII